VLRALAEHTQRTVEDQARLSGAAAAAASGAGGEAGGSGSHVDQVVDMVMQHLLSKEVLYQPMKVGEEGTLQANHSPATLLVTHP
jgi:hypothetical protein